MIHHRATRVIITLELERRFSLHAIRRLWFARDGGDGGQRNAGVGRPFVQVIVAFEPGDGRLLAVMCLLVVHVGFRLRSLTFAQAQSPIAALPRKFIIEPTGTAFS
jgi:hypothetical protein